MDVCCHLLSLGEELIEGSFRLKQAQVCKNLHVASSLPCDGVCSPVCVCVSDVAISDVFFRYVCV